MRNFAMALGPHHIRVNCVHPMGVRTPMVMNEYFRQHKQSMPPGWGANVLNADIAEPEDISDAIVWLCSERARYVTESEIAVDTGSLLM
jgi:NAD(P)-dependent dehydrogenase (short-subunit alcohol dehydrogenase family)